VEAIAISQIIFFTKLTEAIQIIFLELEIGTGYNEAVLLGTHDG
jgi:hypothetical protein